MRKHSVSGYILFLLINATCFATWNPDTLFDIPVLRLQSDCLTYSLRQHVITCRAPAQITIGTATLKCRHFLLNTDTWILSAWDTVVFSADSQQIQGDSFTFDIRNNSGVIRSGSGIQYVSDHGASPVPGPMQGNVTEWKEPDTSAVKTGKIYLCSKTMLVHPYLRLHFTDVTFMVNGKPDAFAKTWSLPQASGQSREGFEFKHLGYSGYHHFSGALGYSFLRSDRFYGRADISFEQKNPDAQNRKDNRVSLDLSTHLFPAQNLDTALFINQQNDDTHHFELTNVTTLPYGTTVRLAAGQTKDSLGREWMSATAGMHFPFSAGSHIDASGTWLESGLRSAGLHFTGKVSTNLGLELESTYRNQTAPGLSESYTSLHSGIHLHWSPSGLYLETGIERDWDWGLDMDRFAPALSFRTDSREIGRTPLRYSVFGDIQYTETTGRIHVTSYFSRNLFLLQTPHILLDPHVSLDFSTLSGVVLRTGTGKDADFEFRIRLQSVGMQRIRLKLAYFYFTRRKLTGRTLIEGTAEHKLLTEIDFQLMERDFLQFTLFSDPREKKLHSLRIDLFPLAIRKWDIRMIAGYDFDLKDWVNLDATAVCDLDVLKFRFIWEQLRHEFRVELVSKMF